MTSLRVCVRPRVLEAVVADGEDSGEDLEGLRLLTQAGVHQAEVQMRH